MQRYKCWEVSDGWEATSAVMFEGSEDDKGTMLGGSDGGKTTNAGCLKGVMMPRYNVGRV